MNYFTALRILSPDWSSTTRSGSVNYCWSAPSGGCGEYLSEVFPVAVIDALLYLSGDVETNPGPLCEFISYSLGTCLHKEGTCNTF